MDTPLTFGAWLKRRRRGLGLTQRTLGQQAGYSSETLRKVEAGELRPSVQMAERLALALRIDRAEWLPFTRFARGELDVDNWQLPTQTVEFNLGRASSETTRLPTEAAPLRHNLPPQLTRFFGRENDIAQLGLRLGEWRLVTLAGLGGVGKTRLALRFAENNLSNYVHGIGFVDLTALSEPGLVATAVAAALGVRDEPDQPAVERLIGDLRGRQFLLVLDNCEHLLDATAQLSEVLLQACPELTLLATSREPLGIAGEAIYRVDALPCPNPKHLPALQDLSRYDAIQLFVDRARAQLPGYQVAEHNVAALARICHQLDGIPLALELAAAWIKVLNAEQLAERLVDSYRLLSRGRRTGVSRHKTLEATLDWSYKLLTESERALLQRLSVFAGGWSLAAAEAVCADETHAGEALRAAKPGQRQLPVLDLLASLVAKSLVIAHRDPGAEPRYAMLETVRQYAREKLAASGDTAPWRTRHRDYFLAQASQVATIPQPVEDRLQPNAMFREADNVRLALEWSFSDPGGQRDPEAGPKLMFALDGLVWPLTAQEQREWDLRLLAWCEAHPDIARPLAIRAQLFAALDLVEFDLPTSISKLRDVAQLARNLPVSDARLLVEVLVWLGHIVGSQEALDEAQAVYAEAEAVVERQLSSQLSPDERLRLKLTFLAEKARLANKRCQYAEAQAHAREYLQLHPDAGTMATGFNIRGELGHACLELGEYEAARQEFLEARRLATMTSQARRGSEADDGNIGVAYANRCLGLTELRLGNLDQAAEHCQASLRESYEKGFTNFMASAVALAAGIAAARAESLRAATLSGAAHGLYALSKRPPWEDTTLDTLLPGWRAGPNQLALQHAYEQGKSMTPAEVLEEVVKTESSSQ
jgi:predicted ATPase/DNA-binding XRE family transcriptional regulator